MGLIGQNQQTSFANPQNGQAPIDADVVRNNDNAVVAKHNAHDGDPTIHVQTGTLAERPAAGTINAVYLDSSGRLYRDNGVAWVEVPYARLDASGTNTFTNSISVGGALEVEGEALLGSAEIAGNASVGGDQVVTGGLAVGGAALITSNLVVTGTVTATSLSGTMTVPASNVTAGTYPDAAFTYQNDLTVDGTLRGGSVFATSGQIRGARLTGSGNGATLNFTTANHWRLTMTGNGTVTLAGGVAGGIYTVEVVQDNVGSRTVAWSANVLWPSGSTPASTTTANRKDVYSFFFDGTYYLGGQFGANFASTV